MDHSGSQTEMSAKSYASVTKVTTSTTALPTPQETLTNFDRNNRQEERAPEAFRRENNGRERERAEYEQQAVSNQLNKIINEFNCRRFLDEINP